MHFIHEQTEAKWQTYCRQFSVVYTIAVFTIGMENLFSKREDVNVERG